MLDTPPAPTQSNPPATVTADRRTEQPVDVAAVLIRGRSRGRLRRVAIGAVVVVAVAAAAIWWFTRGTEASFSYATAPVTRGNLIVNVTAAGTIQPINQVDVSSELSGTIGSIAVDFNSPVKAGQTLATLKTDKLAAAVEQGRAQLAAREADVAQARVGADQTQTALTRAQSLRAMGTITQEALDTAKSTSDKAVAALAAADANRQIAVANLSIAQSDLGKATVVSPINGVVLSRNVDVGQTVAASLSAPVLFTLAEDLAKMQLEVDIDEADVGKVNDGDRATFAVAAYDERVFPAAVSQVRYAPSKAEGVVSYKAILTVDNSALLLRPGMTATATIIVDNVSNALLVPNAALRYTPPAAPRQGGGLLGGLNLRVPGGGGGGPPGGGPPPGAGANGAGQATRVVPAQGAAAAERTVWVLRDGKPVAVPVRTGVTDGSRTEIVGGVLTETDLVITGSKAAS
jgi:HlyD family secretion protein